MTKGRQRRRGRTPGAAALARRIARGIAAWLGAAPPYDETVIQVKRVTRDKRAIAKAKREGKRRGKPPRFPLVIDPRRARIELRFPAVFLPEEMPDLPPRITAPEGYAVGIRIMTAPVPGDRDPWRNVNPLTSDPERWRNDAQFFLRDVATLPSQRAEIKWNGVSVVKRPIVRGVLVYVAKEG